MMNQTVICKLNGTNYDTWSYQMKLVLMESDLWTMVQPGEVRPSESETEKLKLFVTREGKTLAKLCLSIGDEQQQHVRHLNTPREVWEELEKLYAPRDSKFRILQLRRQLYCEKLSGNMDSYLGKINHVVSELTKVGDKVEDGDLAMIILCGLPQDWDHIVSTICNLPEAEFTSATVKRRLLAESERKGSVPSQQQHTGALAVKTSKPVCSDQKPKGKTAITCYKCGKKGHIARECYKKNNVKWGKSSKYSGGDSGIGNMSLSCGSLVGVTVDMWIIDSGATHHMTPIKACFSELKEGSGDLGSITIADGTTTPVAGMGTVCVNIVGQGQGLKGFTAENTIFAPGIKHGVLSVLQATENKRKVIFDNEGCRILDEQGNILIRAERLGRLFFVRTTPRTMDDKMSGEEAYTTQLSGETVPLSTWHRRLMHVNSDQILKMVKSQAVIGLNCQQKTIEKCDACIQGKSSRLPFPKLDKGRRESVPLALVHSDLLGPLDTQSWGGAKYMLSIVDEATRYVFVFFLKEKSEVLKRVKDWVTEAERQTQKSLQKIRTDNGLEFCSGDWDAFCRSRGIVHERTMTYTPQQNGIAERLNRTLLDLVRSTMSDCDLPKASWAELTYTAAYVRNRVTNKHDEEHTPYELWFQRKPSLRHLKCCGCEVYVHIPKQKRKSKLAARAQRGLLVGYALHGRGWRVWIPELHQIVESRDCIFKEEKMTRNSPVVQGDTTTTEFYEDSESSQSELVKVEEQRETAERVIEIENENSEDTLPQHKARGRPRRGIDEHRGTPVRIHPMELRDRKVPQHSALLHCDEELTDQPHVFSSLESQGNSPTSYEEALGGPEADKWLDAVAEEMESLRKHEVWELAELPAGVVPIKCKWVLNKKTDADGNVSRYKARLVARGYSQSKGIDYEEVYAPVSSFDTIRLLTAVGVEENWIMDQYDIKSAYLHGEIDRVIYMEQPEGNRQAGKEHLYCKLKKSLYGLKQSGRCWNEHLDKKLRQAGFKRNPVDPCVYELQLNIGKVILTAYVDDMITLAENQAIRNRCKEILGELFEISQMGPVSYILGVKFTHGTNGSITLTQSAYVERLLLRFGMQDANGAKTPMEVGLAFETSKDDNSGKELPYRELIGGLLYLAQRTRPDIAYAVGRLAQFCTSFDRQHWNAAKRVLRYIKATKDLGITYKPTGEQMVAYVDADWASRSEDRKSTSGYVLMLAGAPILWRSTKQTVIALSTMEAEYIALSLAVREVTWVRELLLQLDEQSFVQGHTQIWCDSQAAIAHAKSFVDKSRTKHIDIKCHFIREKVADETVHLGFVTSGQNVADVLTKALGRCLHDLHCNKLLSAK